MLICELQKADKGAEVSVFAALSAKLETDGGKYIEEFSVENPSKYSKDINLQTRLWNLTWRTLQPWLDEVDDVTADEDDNNSEI